MALLEVNDIHAHYGGIEALKGVSLTVEEGEVVTLIGSNGAGKSTTLRAITGLTPASAGSVIMNGEDITRVAAHEIVDRGIALSPEGRHCFSRMTVRENLDLGAHRRRREGTVARGPRARVRAVPAAQGAREAEGGHDVRRRAADARHGPRADGRPKLLLLDEPSMGIAPILVQRIYETIAEINRTGTTILLVEQNANYALDVSKRGYVLETGRVVLSGDSSDLRTDPEVQRAYLGA